MAFASNDRKGPVQGEGIIEYSFDDDTPRVIFSVSLEENEMAVVSLQNMVANDDLSIGSQALVETTILRPNFTGDIELGIGNVNGNDFGVTQATGVNIGTQSFEVQLTGVAATPVTGKLHYKFIKRPAI